MNDFLFKPIEFSAFAAAQAVDPRRRCAAERRAPIAR
jgi:hypothetical protein